MAEKTVPIEINNKQIGSIRFDDSPQSLALQRTALGHNLMIPAVIHVSWDDRNEPHPILTNLQLTISCYDGPSKLELGRVRDDSVYFGSTFGKGDTARFDWINPAPALIYLEGSRPQNAAPKLNFAVRAQIQFLVKATRIHQPDVVVIDPGYNSVVTFPHMISGEVDINYAANVWNGLIKKIIKAPV